MSGSPTGALSALDWKSIGWTLLTAAAAAILTAILDSVLPDLKEKGLIDAGIFTLLTTFLHAVRKFLTDTRLPPKVVVLLVAGLSLLGASASAQDLVDLGGPDGEYHYKVIRQGGKIVKVVGPLAVHKPVQPDGEQPPVTPTNPALSPFAQEVQRQTAAVLQSGGSKTTGAGISAAYSLASSGVADGSIATDKVFAAVKAATDVVMANVSDAQAWRQWRSDISAALNALQAQGKLATKEQVAAVLADVAKGLDAATGNTFDPKTLSALKAGTELSLDTDGRLDGILDGVNIRELIALIKEIIDILKAFGILK
jgi:hypothetical protein